jgi:hypothetical protein
MGLGNMDEKPAIVFLSNLIHFKRVKEVEWNKHSTT